MASSHWQHSCLQCFKTKEDENKSPVQQVDSLAFTTRVQRQYKALAQYQAEKLAQLREERTQPQNLPEQLANGPRLAEHYVSQLSQENDKGNDEHHADEEAENVEKSAAPRLSQELLEAKEQEAPEDSLDEMYSTPSVQGDLSDCHQPYSSASSSLENQLTCPAVDVAGTKEFQKNAK
ncbi:putative NBPF family member NBPF5 [Callithrix jacchus]